MRVRGDARERREAAFAKVNLGLAVLGSRPDGYHEVRTVLQSIDFRDDVDVSLRVSHRRSVRLSCDNADLNHEGNLAFRAADLLLRKLRLKARVRIRLRKRIPVGAGLGGGSSDAAAVLRAISRLLADPAPRHSLVEVASALGSDVPYFLVGGTAFARGRGTEVTPLAELPPAWIALALPETEVSTAWAYRALSARREQELTTSGPPPRMKVVRSGPVSSAITSLKGLSEWMANDFEGVVFRQYPALGSIKSQILACGARHALLSGSGSAVFGIFDSQELAKRACEALAAEGSRALATRFVNRAAWGLRREASEGPVSSDSRN